MQKEEYVYYLGDIPGLSGNNKYLAIGTNTFTPLELSFKAEVDLSQVELGAKLYIGSGKRDVVKSIIGRAGPALFQKLDKKSTLEILEKIVLENEEKFIKFVNTAGPYSMKRHSLSLLPGIGEKVLVFILKERDNRKIRNLKDFEKRCNENKIKFSLTKALSQRLYNELTGISKERLFIH